MPTKLTPRLQTNLTPGAAVTQLEGGAWRLKIPPGPAGRYRLAQLDDYANLPRRALPWLPPLTLSLRARVSAPDLPGTWGFGLWNDPFSLSLGFGGGTRRLPTLPNAAWFFCASPPNYLSLRDDLPAQGFLAQTFRSPSLPAPVLALGLPALPLLAWPWAARWLRSLGRRVITQDAAAVKVDATQWHTYTLKWGLDRVTFGVDDQTIFETKITPHGPLGLVLWIDNQYASFPPNGRLSYGTLQNQESAWLEIKDIDVVRET
ncbi:MAG: hypothetical protein KKD28_02575 [Chloroflexi bacterium]|nr:hypothetical protein [Chloroflexota bacterium]